MNGGLHIKQEGMLPPEHHMQARDPDQVHHIIKREMHSEYDDIDHDSHADGMAEDLTVVQDHNSDTHHVINA